MSSLESTKKDDVLSTTLDDSSFDVDLIEVDDLINSATRLLEEVCSSRPTVAAAIEASATSPHDDAIEQVQRFLSSIRECEEEEDVVFVEARPGNALPVGARTTAVVDLCTPNADEVSPSTSNTRSRRQAANIAPVAFPDLNNVSPQPSTTTRSRKNRRQPKSEPGLIKKTVSPNRTRTDGGGPQTNHMLFTPPSNAGIGDGLPPLTCAICMENVINRQPCSTSCGHIFCQQCIMQSIRITSKCPLCNTKLTRNKVHRVYF